MTYLEITEKFKELFILIVENAGEETSNKNYLDVENILKKNESMIEQAVEDEPPLEVFISLCISFVVVEVHSIDNMCEKSIEETTYLVNDFWERYLKNPLKKFTAKYGLSTIKSLTTAVKVLHKYDQ